MFLLLMLLPPPPRSPSTHVFITLVTVTSFDTFPSYSIVLVALPQPSAILLYSRTYTACLTEYGHTLSSWLCVSGSSIPRGSTAQVWRSRRCPVRSSGSRRVGILPRPAIVSALSGVLCDAKVQWRKAYASMEASRITLFSDTRAQRIFCAFHGAPLLTSFLLAFLRLLHIHLAAYRHLKPWSSLVQTSSSRHLSMQASPMLSSTSEATIQVAAPSASPYIPRYHTNFTKPPSQSLVHPSLYSLSPFGGALRADKAVPPYP